MSSSASVSVCWPCSHCIAACLGAASTHAGDLVPIGRKAMCDDELVPSEDNRYFFGVSFGVSSRVACATLYGNPLLTRAPEPRKETAGVMYTVPRLASEHRFLYFSEHRFLCTSSYVVFRYFRGFVQLLT